MSNYLDNMKSDLTLKSLAKACRGTLINGENIVNTPAYKDCISESFSGNIDDIGITTVVTDNRKAEAGSLFICIKGEKTDGHKYAAAAYAAGAVCCLCEEKIETDFPYILVDKTTDALKEIAAYHRDNITAKIVAVIGSVGKTSTKEAIWSVLKKQYNVHKTEGNFNNEIGMPLTLLGIKKEHELAVIEMGISYFGEMTRLARVCRPDVLVFTNVGNCHLENLIDRDGVLRAKSEAFAFVKENGLIVLNGDDDKLITVNHVDNCTLKYFSAGGNSELDAYAASVENLGIEGTKVSLCYGGEKLDSVISVPGNYMVSNALAATVVGRYFNIPMEIISEGIAEIATIKGRNNFIKTDKYTLIDDCYNASPVSMIGALDVLSGAKSRRVAVLGDMFELGESTNMLHFSVGERAGRGDIDHLICIGKLAKNIYKGAAGMSKSYYKDIESFTENINKELICGDTILIKASHGMHFEKIVELLSK